MPLQFYPFDRTAAEYTAPYFHTQTDRFCDCTVGVNYMWRKPFRCSYTICHKCLVLQVDYGGKDSYFTLPLGVGDKNAALSALEQHCREVDVPLQFSTVSENGLRALQKRYPHMTVNPQRDYFDYLYHYADLATFSGRRYSRQRNHIHQFEKKYPDWQYHTLTESDIPSVKTFLRDLLERKNNEQPLSPAERTEAEGCFDLLNAMHSLGMTGGYITVQDNIVSFSVGEKIKDTLYVHIEKGDTRYNGVYQLMVREYAAHNAAQDLLYINREDDAGDLGLRQSKLSYRPCAILEKNIVIINNRKEMTYGTNASG